MNKSIVSSAPFFLALFVASFFFPSCQKTSLDGGHLSREKSSLMASSGNASLDSLITKYNLVQLTTLPAGFQKKYVTTVADGSAFFDNVFAQTSGRTQTGHLSSPTNNNVIMSVSKTLTSASNEDGDGLHIIITIQFGNWSSMVLSFDYTSNSNGTYNVSNATATVNGATVGIGYTQTSSKTFSVPGAANFAINGTFAAGISAGSTTFGYSTPYYYSVNYSPSTKNWTVTEGRGSK